MHCLWELEVWKLFGKDFFDFVGHILVFLGALSQWFSGQNPVLFICGDCEGHAAEDDYVRFVVGVDDIIWNPRCVFEELKLEMTIGSSRFLSEIDMGATSWTKGVGTIWSWCVELTGVKLVNFTIIKRFDICGNTFMTILMSFQISVKLEPLTKKFGHIEVLLKLWLRACFPKASDAIILVHNILNVLGVIFNKI